MQTTGANLPLAMGDRVTWTLQYDRARSLGFTNRDSKAYFFTNSPLLTHVVDQSNGYQFRIPVPSFQSTIAMYASMKAFEINQETMNLRTNVVYVGGLALFSNSPLPTMDLRSLRLSDLPLELSSIIGSQFYYGSFIESHDGPVGFSNFQAEVTSLTLSSAPEPGSLSLFAFGAVGLSVRLLRRRLAADDGSLTAC